MRQMHFVVFFSRSILANSFGEWILEKMYVLPIDMHGTDNILAKDKLDNNATLNNKEKKVKKFNTRLET